MCAIRSAETDERSDSSSSAFSPSGGSVLSFATSAPGSRLALKRRRVFRPRDSRAATRRRRSAAPGQHLHRFREV